MITAISIQDLMTKDVVTVASTDSINEIERIFKRNHLRHAPVCESGNVVGMISLIDLRRNIPDGDREDIPNKEVLTLTASQFMAPDPVTLQSDQTVKEAALLFSENDFHAVPVLERGKLVGIISTTDIIRFLIDSINELEENSRA